jgi:hypothetical protein
MLKTHPMAGRFSCGARLNTCFARRFSDARTREKPFDRACFLLGKRLNHAQNAPNGGAVFPRREAEYLLCPPFFRCQNKGKTI